MADVGDLNVQIKADDKASATMRNVSANVGKAAGKMKTAMLASSAAIGAAFLLQTKSFLDAGDELHKMNQRTLISVETLSALDHIAGLSGQQLNLFGVAAKMTEKLLLGLSEGAVKHTEVVGKLGLSYKDAQEMGFEKFMLELMFRLADVDNEIERGIAGVDIFKGAWTNLKNVIGTMNGKELKELIENQKDSTFWNLENATAAADFNDAVANIQLELKQIAFTLVEDYLPSMKDAVDRMLIFVKGNKEAIYQTGRLALQFAKIAITIIAVSKAIQLLIITYARLKAAKVLMILWSGKVRGAIIGIRTAIIGLQVVALAPFIIAIGIAAAILGVLYGAFMIAWKNSEKFREKIEGLVKWVKDLANVIKKFLIPEYKSYDDIIDEMNEGLDKSKEAMKDLEEQIKNSIYTTGDYDSGLAALNRTLSGTKEASDKVAKSYGDTIKKSAELEKAKRAIYGGLQVVNMEFAGHEGQVALTAEQYVKARKALEAYEESLKSAGKTAADFGGVDIKAMMKAFPSLTGSAAMGKLAQAFDMLEGAKMGTEFGQLGTGGITKAKETFDTGQFRLTTVNTFTNSADIATININNQVRGYGQN